ncbi:CapA family protein [Cytobacillus purgationiresistens]|uniref:Poly-gamma-glutamate synthesis protein (Capsule biosynthesis protein) n=1 Tax=Cytobacillus purgationiresistens TaxID=863449 RepID=A0ABU0AD08_9BACI|nr:CapA family protein [Cytobacillus purgationiresistens]MDQ0269141.1 poly-gamma-glutamate synthesis protein (capsule biosynthesis protein) [Cytobacillus purgationiresistens]
MNNQTNEGRDLTFHEKLLKFLKSQKKRIHIHLLILFPILLIVFVLSYTIDTRKVAQVKPANDAVLTGSIVGDVMTGRYVDEITDRHGYNHLFRYTQPFFNESDYVTGNYENPATEREVEPREGKSIALKTDHASVDGLAGAGFNAVALANNHMMDFGEQALADTLAVLDEKNIDAVGAGNNIEDASNRISYQEINGRTLATLSFSDLTGEQVKADHNSGGILDFTPDTFIPLTAEAKANADLVLVHAHWGNEYNSRASERQQELARALSDAGADIIIGHHPHVLETVEVYNDSVIFYSLGNFIFDQGWTRTRETALVQFHLLESGETRFEITPMKIREATPAPLNNWDKLAEWSIKRQLTRDLNVDWEYKDNQLVFTVDQNLDNEKGE